MKGTQLSIAMACLFGAAINASEKGASPEIKVDAPFQHYWDSESWEKGSSASFWRLTNPSTPPTSAPKPLSNPSQAENQRNPSASSQTETQPVLDRQSEK